jgi:hypothetical protein
MATISPSRDCAPIRATPRTALPAARRLRSARRRDARHRQADSRARCPSPSRSPCPANRCWRGVRRLDVRMPGQAMQATELVELVSGRSPRPISTLYRAGASCPFDEKKMSAACGPFARSRISFRNSQLMISIELKLVPMWPDHAPAIMYSVLMRASAANARARNHQGRSPREGERTRQRERTEARAIRPGRSVCHPWFRPSVSHKVLCSASATSPTLRQAAARPPSSRTHR